MPISGERVSSDVNSIQVRIETISQLFFNLDPSPFREKDLDKDAEEFIVSWARELPDEVPVKIVVYLPVQELQRPEAAEIGPAITQFFAYRAQVIGYEIRELFRIGWRSLVVGTAVLLLSITAGQTIAASLNPAPLGELIEQSLLIFRLGCELAADRDLPVRVVADRAAPRSLSEARGGEGRA